MADKIITHGIPDEMFERGSVPMTKEEVRSIVISKLRLAEDSRVLDIGAGTGSVTVECALIAKKGIVYSFERGSEAVSLIRRNTEKFKTENVVIIEGDAPGTLEQAGVFDRAFVGGSGGNIFGILDSVHNKIYERGRIVVTAVTLDTLFEARNFFSYMKYSHEIVQVAVTRITETAGFSMLKAQSPVFIISAEKGES